VSALVGIYFETLLAATLLFLGLHLAGAAIAVLAVMLLSIAGAIYRGTLRVAMPVIPRPRWYEWLLLASFGEKLVLAGWQLVDTRTYFDDALTHWSGRARALFGQVNWSFDPSSPLFLGKHVGSPNYPLLTIMWRTLSAKANG